jgi:hypothetical protein
MKPEKSQQHFSMKWPPSILHSLIEHYLHHCDWVTLRPSDSDFSQNWKPSTREIPLLSLRLSAMIDAQWFWLQPELEARDQGDSPTLTAVECHDWRPVILTSARIGSLGPGRFPYSHCGWVPWLTRSDSDFSQSWKPGTRDIPLLSLWFDAIDAQWFWLWPELEAWDRGDSPTLTAVECHWGPVIQTLARIVSPGPRRFPTLRIPRGILGAWITGNPHTTQFLINQVSCADEYVPWSFIEKYSC